MAICERCGKGPRTGNRVAHSKLATRRLFRPNLQRATIVDEKGQRRQISVCAKCLKALSKTA